MANLYLERSGRWWVLAAGATNTNGKGGPWGRIPANSANSKVIGIEAGNNGIGEAWPEGMQESYTTGVAALAKHYRHRHRERPGASRVGAQPQGRSRRTQPVRLDQPLRQLEHGRLPQRGEREAGKQPHDRHS